MTTRSGNRRRTSTPTATRRAGVYLRISEDRTGREAGVNRQEPDCRALAARLGWEVVDRYVDNDISAYSGKRRPGYERLKADLLAGRIDAIIVWHPDRLYRRSRDLLDLIDLLGETKPEVATVQAGTVDLSTPNGRLVAKIGADVAEHESEHKAERVKAWHRQRAEAGQPNGGMRPFGYCPDRVTVDEAEADLIREGARRVLAGEGRFRIVTDWNARGFRTVGGSAWSPVRFRDMLIGPRLAGLRQHNGRLYPAAWPAILDSDTWKAVQAALKSQRATPGRRATYVLSGILRCGLCGNGLTGNRSTRNGVVHRYYRCNGKQSNDHGCGKIARNAERIEEHVVEDVLAALSGPGFLAAIQARSAALSNGDDTVAAITTLEGRLERLKSEYATEGLWTKGEFVKLKAELEEKLSAAYGRLQTAAAGNALPPAVAGGDLRGWWPTATVEQQRQVIGLVVDRALIHPVGKGGANGYRADATEIIWKA